MENQGKLDRHKRRKNVLSNTEVGQTVRSRDARIGQSILTPDTVVIPSTRHLHLVSSARDAHCLVLPNHLNKKTRMRHPFLFHSNDYRQSLTIPTNLLQCEEKYHNS